MITILYFAAVKEKLGIAREVMELPAGMRQVDVLAASLQARGGVWVEALERSANLKVAINQAMSTWDGVIKDGDEIAFFPPVTGG